MFRRSGRISATVAIVALGLLAAASPAGAIKLGSSLKDHADTGICPTDPPALEATCTVTQLNLQAGNAAYGGLLAEHHGVITSWQVTSGPASPATAAVRMRLRLLHGGKPVADAIEPFVSLPLAEPGIHRVPARLPLVRDDELGLDLSVLGTGTGVASAPIAHSEPELGEVGEWVPSLGNSAEPITSYRDDSELLLAATIEPDADSDGYGDLTQDRCVYDPRRQSPCLPDHRLPRFTVHYPRHQDFLHSGKAFLTVKPNELAEVYAAPQLETPKATWGIYGDRAWIDQGRSAKLLITLPPKPIKAGKAAIAKGDQAYIKCFLTVIDASGNRRHETIRIKPKGS